MIEFNPYDPAVANDPYPMYKRLRDESPVNYSSGLNFWSLSRFADITAAFQDTAAFSSTGGTTIEGVDKGSASLSAKDPPEHRWHKALIMKVFTVARMAALETYIRGLVTRLLDEAAEKDEFDFVYEFALQAPLQVISQLIGIPDHYREELHRLAETTLGRGADTTMEGVMTASHRIHAICAELIQERKVRPREDPITLLMESEVQDDKGVARKLTDKELGFRFSELILAGHDTVAKTIPNGAVAFQRFPEQRRKLIEDPRLTRSAVEEIMRYDPSSHMLGRTTTRDVELHGVTIPAGSKTMLLIGSAGRDERRFENPDVFDITREPSPEATYFGYGAHRCLGIHLARLELNVVFEELFRRFPDFEVDVASATCPPYSNIRGISRLPCRLGARVR